MTTELDIIDTAVKIGFGAAITGITSYFLSRQKNDHDQEKQNTVQNKELAQKIALKLENVEAHINEAVVFLHNSDIAAAKKAFIPASKEAYTARALTNIAGSDEMITKVDDVITLVESMFEAITTTPPKYKKADDIFNELPAVKKLIYPYIREIYVNKNT